MRTCHLLVFSSKYARYGLGVFLDLAKAFDSLDRTILYDKLKSYGIREVELDWLVYYFRPRQQFTVFTDATS